MGGSCGWWRGAGREVGEVSEFEELSEIVRCFFDDAKPTIWQLFPLFKATIASHDEYDLIDKPKELEKLERFSQSLLSAAQQFNGLHGTIKFQLEHSFSDRAEHHTVKFFAGEDPYKNFDQISTVLRFLIDGLGLESGIPTAGLLKESRRFVESMPTMNHQARSAETWEKVRLVEAARCIWREYSGAEPPRIPSSGRYYDFVQKLIEHHNFRWNVEATFRAWNHNSDRAHTNGWI